MILDPAPPVEVVRELFEEYSRQIGVDLCVQNFAAELAGLPDNYDRILVARDGEALAGCAALRPYPYGTENGAAELKRLYVRAAYRGMGLGRRMTEAMIQEASVRGYQLLRLDTLASMTAAIAMYRAIGFQQFTPARPSDFPGQLFFELRLDCPRLPPISPGSFISNFFSPIDPRRSKPVFSSIPALSGPERIFLTI